MDALQLRMQTAERAMNKYLAFGHLPSDLQEVSKHFYDVGVKMFQRINKDLEPENVRQFEIGLQKLIEAKDAFVRVHI